MVDTTSHKDESGRNDSDKDKSEDETAGDRNDSDDEKSEDETAGNESDDASSSDYSYTRSDKELISSSRNSEGGYDSVDALLDSVEESVEEESDSQLPPEPSPRPWGYDPFDLPRSNSSSRNSSWSNIDIEELPQSVPRGNDDLNDSK